jgi:hypothetical protein
MWYVENTPILVHSITVAAIQSIPLRDGGMTSFPITFRLEAIIMMTAINRPISVGTVIAA